MDVDFKLKLHVLTEFELLELRRWALKLIHLMEVVIVLHLLRQHQVNKTTNHTLYSR